MKWTLIRKQYREDGIFGELTSADGVHFLVTLERAYKITDEHYPKSVEFYPKIQEGIHSIAMYASPKHGGIVPMLNSKDDQGHFFEIHVGNYNDDSDGCILVGLAEGFRDRAGKLKMLTSSKDAFNRIIAVGIDELEVIGAP